MNLRGDADKKKKKLSVDSRK